jgi:hypothetical protein
MRSLLRIGTTLLLLAFVLVGVAYAGLRAQAGNGAAGPGSRLVATERRPLGAAVDSVELSGPLNLTLRQGPSAALEVRGEQRLLPNVGTTTDGRLLRIGPRGILLRHRQPIEVLVTLPALASLRISGSGEHTASGFAGERVELALEGSGNLRFNGRYRDIDAALHGSGALDVTGGSSDRVKAESEGSGTLTLVGSSRTLEAVLRGSGDLDARHLHTDDATLSLTGSGSAAILARRRVQVSLAGSADAVVHGNPAERSVSRAGSGSVEFVD